MAVTSFIWIQEFGEELVYKSVVILFICIFTFLIASMFIGVYEMIIDTIFICFCEDSEKNDGSPEKPYFMSKSLLKFMAQEDKRAQQRTEREYKLQQERADKAKMQHEKSLRLQLE